jgi:hypothetical protein
MVEGTCAELEVIKVRVATRLAQVPSQKYKDEKYD